MYVWFCILAVLAGTLIPLQFALNSQLKIRLDNPYYATLASIIVSAIFVSSVCLIVRHPIPNLAQATPWWIWTGGFVGVTYLFISMILAPKLGATALVASIIGGQMLCSLLLDHFGLIGFAQHSLNAGRIAGAALLAAGVFLIQKY
jgi:Uncharacterized protein conserved in bacteria